VVGFTRGETEYVISADPAGRYVKMAGMEDDEAQSVLEGGAEGVPVDPERTFDSKPLWARALVISAGVIVNFLFAVLVFGRWPRRTASASSASRRSRPPSRRRRWAPRPRRPRSPSARASSPSGGRR
jgi:membrane-associated protease RseP (regulator of RpoE activity)